ncbi:putative copper resistance protein D [Nocardiopsis flavescens]|uniref:Putative copper resistance protein D n=1 Tax=Nocardiopsis flavescens TaxID=758803 RepID=A0A1M6E5U9_9ACTN|nr:putative copper resistance protein D [Nocardiopsis flavescens]
MAPPAKITPTPDRAGAPRASAAPVLAAVAAVLCLAGLGLTLVLGGAAFPEVIPGLPDAGDAVRWGLPLSKAVMETAGVLTIGALLLAVVLLPSDKGRLSRQAVGYVHAATWSALAWAAGAVGTLYFQASEFLARPLGRVSVDEVTAYAGSVSGGIALMFVILLTTGILLFGRTVTGATGALWLLVLALAATTPPALTGHSASAGAHELAVTGLALHVITISVWTGGLALLTFHAMRARGDAVETAAARFSRLALWAYVGVAISGLASALARIESLDALLRTEYGLIILVKVVLFAVLGAFGYLHREFALKGLDGAAKAPGWPARRRLLFLRIAAVEVLVMALVIGVSVGLGRTAPPPPLDSRVDPAALILGFPVPPPMDAANLLTLWRPDLFFIMLVVVAGGLYAAGVVRLVRRGDSWPAGRAVAFTAGLLTIVAVQLSGFATYAMVLFSTHMIQHMVLSMLTPILLVLGAPVTLALRALHPVKRRGDRGPREWLNLFLNSRYSKLVTHPAVATPLFILSPYALYFTPLFPTLMNDHLGHLFMGVHFLVTGFLFYWVIVGIDPAPRKMPYLLRILLLLLAMGFHAFFGISIMMQSAPIAMDYYGQFDVPWLDGLAEDQYAGGGVAWALGEIPTLLVMLALVVQWSRDDEKQERRRERHARRDGSDDADLDAYNAYLAELDRRNKAISGAEAPAAEEKTAQEKAAGEKAGDD